MRGKRACAAALAMGLMAAAVGCGPTGQVAEPGATSSGVSASASSAAPTATVAPEASESASASPFATATATATPTPTGDLHVVPDLFDGSVITGDGWTFAIPDYWRGRVLVRKDDRGEIVVYSALQDPDAFTNESDSYWRVVSFQTEEGAEPDIMGDVGNHVSHYVTLSGGESHVEAWTLGLTFFSQNPDAWQNQGVTREVMNDITNLRTLGAFPTLDAVASGDDATVTANYNTIEDVTESYLESGLSAA